MSRPLNGPIATPEPTRGPLHGAGGALIDGVDTLSRTCRVRCRRNKPLVLPGRRQPRGLMNGAGRAHDRRPTPRKLSNRERLIRGDLCDPSLGRARPTKPPPHPVPRSLPPCPRRKGNPASYLKIHRRKRGPRTLPLHLIPPAILSPKPASSEDRRSTS